MRVLLVEDEHYLAEAVAHMIKKSRYSVDIAGDGEEGLRLARSGAYDAIVLDIMLPKLSGIDVLKALRREANVTPIIILSAKSDTLDKVEGLELGADDYLAKPFKSSELVARIGAITRRHSHADTLIFGDIELEPRDHALLCNHQRVSLSAHEYSLLELLIKQQGATVPAATLFHYVWGDVYMDSGYISVYVSHLRRKLRELQSEVLIVSRRGVGYKLVSSETRDVS